MKTNLPNIDSQANIDRETSTPDVVIELDALELMQIAGGSVDFFLKVE